ncbi:hypothetical protein A3C67_00610 [Candidatus Nomurabacteria bacterium RIFCSPHIGHO2_02_FULL_42_19]|uniref:DUF378 domain-containing protein n=1 Tax=Candidatus Nomurabacteria bacterium RIFCSPHIGHO2_02_FULL_42_19 TaxID=1801756 RepID=A0A1F6W0Z0_9BACT|nr:MAG: hypothetical protein A3C67_00610 [Candidatus Nomurabacteria bacterium RIFCSPHIGHO2_02_FULL_42_19]
MCGSNCGCCHEGGCNTSLVIKILLIVGAVNWGLVGLGMLLGDMDWNVIYMFLGGVPVVEATVYILVGVAGVMKLFGCKCKKCREGVCSACAPDGSKTEGNM